MFVPDTLIHRLRSGCQTMAYPKGPAPALPDRHGGSLRVEPARCPDGCGECLPVCPTEAITRPAGRPTLRISFGPLPWLKIPAQSGV